MNTTTDKSKQSDVICPFIQKSYKLLEDQKFTDIIDWNEEGTAIVIKQPLEVGKSALPTYFKHKNLTSFIRQLNLYNFRKRRMQNYDYVYCHELFQRGKKHLLKDIKRKNHENGRINAQKALDVLKDLKVEEESKVNEEMEMLRRQNDDNIRKITSLENRLRELAAENQTLRSQVDQQNGKEALLVAFMSEIFKRKDVTLSELHEAVDTHLKVQSPSMAVKRGTESYKTIDEYQLQAETITLVEPLKMRNIGDFLNFTDNSSISTELPTCSSQLKGHFEFDRISVDEMGHQSDNEIQRLMLDQKDFDAERDDFEDFGVMKKLKTAINMGDFGLQTDVNSKETVLSDESLFGNNVDLLGFSQSDF